MSGNPNNLPGNIPKVKEVKSKGTEMILELVEKKEESPKLLSQEEIDRGIFIATNIEKINELKNVLKNINSLEISELQKLIDPLKYLLDEAHKNKIEDTGFIFKEIADIQFLTKVEEGMKKIGENGIYLPHNESEEEKENYSGDGWLLNKDIEQETGLLFDVAGHGKNAAYKKAIVYKLFELAEVAPEDKREEFFNNINNVLKLGGLDAPLNTSYVRAKIRIEKNNSGEKVRKISVEKKGNAICVIAYRDKITGAYVFKSLLNEISIPLAMFEFYTPEQIKQLTTHEGFYPENTQVFLLSDGLDDKRTEGESGFKMSSEELVERLNNKQRKGSINESIMEEINNFKIKFGDDFTVLKFGDDLK